ncbi:hypothetical protein [Caenispirillum bisanense]|uniref:hypothetical protein n=1 Tax=Caenispirillum bisanense TaxID=414052 RepID=UPI0031CF2D1E
MTSEDLRAIVAMETRAPSRADEVRALKLCLRHLIRDAEALELPTVVTALETAVTALDSAAAR